MEYIGGTVKVLGVELELLRGLIDMLLRLSLRESIVQGYYTKLGSGTNIR